MKCILSVRFSSRLHGKGDMDQTYKRSDHVQPSSLPPSRLLRPAYSVLLVRTLPQYSHHCTRRRVAHVGVDYISALYPLNQ